VLAYNRGARGIPPSNALLAHVGYDGWWNKVSKAIEMSPMPSSDLIKLGLPKDEKSDWWSCVVDVPPSALVLNFVFSTKDRSAWDNNNNKDFHTKVLGASMMFDACLVYYKFHLG
jgi:hypothetical protein